MNRVTFLSLLSTLLLGSACASDGNQGPNCEDGKCDNSFEGVCAIVDRAGSTAPECVGAALDDAGACRKNGQFAKAVCCSFGKESGVKRNDELAKRIINEGDACPTTFRDVMASLDASGCETAETRIVETSAHHLQAANLSGDAQRDAMLFGGQVPETGGFHTVTSVECGGSDAENRILFLQSKQFAGEPGKRGADGSLEQPGVSDSSIWEASGLRKSMEAIAWDPTGGPVVDGNPTGVYNYYALEAADENSEACKTFGNCQTPNWTFHGNSAQYLDLNDELKPTGDFFAQKRRCAECHTGGGIIMRELNSPWINWEEDFDTPGARELMAAHGDVLGRDVGRSSGADQEFTIVGDGNALWDKQRIAIANSPEAITTPNPMLKPLFCSVEVNVQTSFSTNVSSIDSSFFFDPTLSDRASSGLRISIDSNTYRDAVNGGAQVIPRLTNGTGSSPLDAPFTDVPGFGVVDTAGGFMVPERSGADMSYVSRLEGAGVLDSDLVKAVLAVDFTRPIFSPTRCDVLSELDLSWDDLGGSVTDSATLTTVITNKLQALADAGSLSEGGAQLLDNLNSPGDIDSNMSDFGDACRARADADEAGFVADVLHMANVYREKAYDQPIYQLIPSSMPAGVDFKIGLGPFRPSSGHTSNARFSSLDCSLESLATGE